jgi:signal transduction histidine kinase
MHGVDRARLFTGLSSVRAALIFGFAIVFALWLLSGYQLVRSLASIRQRVAEVQETYSRGEQILLRIRTNVLLGSIYLRDALIDAASSDATYYRTEIERLRTEGDTLLRGYLPTVEDDNERGQWARLQIELGEYWASRNVAFSNDARTTLQSASLLRTRVVPRRESVIAIIDQVGLLQAAANQRQRREIDQLYSETETRLISMGAGTLIVALVVAVMASRHVSRLQREVERQRLSERQNRRDLERLSARLVDVQEQERRNIARELHDAVGQALTAVKMDIGIALRTESAPRARAALEDAREIMETTLKGVRDLSQLLHPSTLDDFGLPATLTAHLRSFSRRTSIAATLDETLEQRLPSEIEVCVYRIVQEALNNIARHSGATACTVTIHALRGELLLTIDDNGYGMPAQPALPGPGAARGLGLIGMRERAQTLGGTFAADRGESGGTRITVALPLNAGKPSQAVEPDRMAG